MSRHCALSGDCFAGVRQQAGVVSQRFVEALQLEGELCELLETLEAPFSCRKVVKNRGVRLQVSWKGLHCAARRTMESDLAPLLWQ